MDKAALADSTFQAGATILEDTLQQNTLGTNMAAAQEPKTLQGQTLGKKHPDFFAVRPLSFQQE